MYSKKFTIRAILGKEEKNCRCGDCAEKNDISELCSRGGFGSREHRAEKKGGWTSNKGRGKKGDHGPDRRESGIGKKVDDQGVTEGGKVLARIQGVNKRLRLDRGGEEQIKEGGEDIYADALNLERSRTRERTGSLRQPGMKKGKG